MILYYYIELLILINEMNMLFINNNIMYRPMYISGFRAHQYLRSLASVMNDDG